MRCPGHLRKILASVQSHWDLLVVSIATSSDALVTSSDALPGLGTVRWK